MKVRQTDVGSDEKETKTPDKAEVTKNFLMLLDFYVCPLWIMESDGLINIDPYDYLTDVVLSESLLVWYALITSNFLPHNPRAMRLLPL